MIGGLLAEILPWVLGVLAVIGGAWGYGRSREKRGREQTYIETLQDSAKRQEAGRDAVSDLRGAGRDDYLDSLRKNRGRW